MRAFTAFDAQREALRAARGSATHSWRMATRVAGAPRRRRGARVATLTTL
jgi:hypothetical protein